MANYLLNIGLAVFCLHAIKNIATIDAMVRELSEMNTNYTLLSYVIYLPVSILLTTYVSHHLFKHG